MIDEKKILEAADSYIGHAPEVDEGIYVSMRRDAFKDGVTWFKENLWHDASEDPERNKHIITKKWLNDGGYDYEIDYLMPRVSWTQKIYDNNISQWCYISDILLEGGDK